MIRLDNRFPSFREHRLSIPVRENFLAANCSVTTHNGRLYGVVNVIDHYLDARGIFVPINPEHNPRKACRSLMYLARFNDDLSVAESYELSCAGHPPVLPWEFRGFECPRLFSWRGNLHFAACSHSDGEPTEAKFFMGRIDGDDLCDVCDVRELSPERGAAAVEKNWMPEVIGDQLRFHYRLGMLVSPEGVRHNVGNSASFGHFHGGTQVIPYEMGGLCIVHTYRPVEYSHRKISRQHFIRTYQDGQPFVSTPAVEFGGGRLEIATGMAYHPDGKRMVVSYGRVNADDMKPHQEHAFLAEFTVRDLGRIV